MKLYRLAVVLFAIPFTAVAQSNTSYECTTGAQVRRVVVERQGSAPVPCEVVYYKDTEAPGEREVLWNAQNEAGYCEARAGELVERLESFGWQCTAAADDDDDAARNEDDTE